jgi:hypothetical protein
MTEINRQFAEICVQKMRDINLSLSDLQQKAPRGFWESVRVELNRSGISMPGGGQWEKAPQLSQHWKRNETEIAEIISELIGEEISESKQEGVEEPFVVPKWSRGQKKQPDTITREEFEQIKITVEEIKSMLTSPEGAPTYQTGQKESEGQRPLAPAPPQVGKKFTVPRGKVGFTIDSALLKLVEKEAAARGVNMGRLLDTVIWHYYGCPPLSFQKESE